MGVKCETCRFWVRRTDDAGDCHRRSPLVTGGLHCAVSTEWPETSIYTFCGDYEPWPTHPKSPACGGMGER